jgi:hypothetical protein
VDVPRSKGALKVSNLAHESLFSSKRPYIELRSIHQCRQCSQACRCIQHEAFFGKTSSQSLARGGLFAQGLLLHRGASRWWGSAVSSWTRVLASPLNPVNATLEHGGVASGIWGPGLTGFGDLLARSDSTQRLEPRSRRPLWLQHLCDWRKMVLQGTCLPC